MQQHHSQELCHECSGSGVVEHPAWLTVYNVYAHPERCMPFEIALCMCVRGHAEDVVVTGRSALGLPNAWAFPPRLIPCACQEPEVIAEYSVEVQTDYFAAGAAGLAGAA